MTDDNENRIIDQQSQACEVFSKIFEDFTNEIYIFYLRSLRFVAVNRAARENLGYSAEELSNMTALDFSPEFDIDLFRESTDPLLRGDADHLFYNTIHRRKNGTLYPAKVDVQLYDFKGDMLCLAIIVNSDSRIKTRDDSLFGREMPSNALLGVAGDAIVILDDNENVMFWNQAAAEIFGYTGEEIRGESLQRLMLPDEAHYEPYYQGLRAAEKNKGIADRVELKALHKDGREIDVELSISILKIQNVKYTMGIIRDISKRKAAEAELEKSRQQYLELTENAPIGIIYCDNEGNINYINQRTLAILGSGSMEETKRINLLRFPLLVNAGFSQKLKECLEENKSAVFEIEYTSKWDRRMWASLHIKPREENGKVIGAQVILDDATARKQLEEAEKLKEKSLSLMLKGIPSPAWLISKEKAIIAQNAAAAKLIHTRVGDSAESALFDSSCFDSDESGRPIHKATANAEIERNGIVWETWCIPLGEGVRLYYAVDVTKYKKNEEELLLLSITDTLTNIYNRRYFTRELQKEILRIERTGGTFSLIMLDIDHFKSINDRFGHSTGDLVLKKIAFALQQRIRKTDTIARWGGEEFVILLPETGIDAAADLAEELREHLQNKEIPDIGTVTASFGVTSYCAGDTSDSLISKADKLMYAAKAEGRNCVRFTTSCDYTFM